MVENLNTEEEANLFTGVEPENKGNPPEGDNPPVGDNTPNNDNPPLEGDNPPAGEGDEGGENNEGDEGGENQEDDLPLITEIQEKVGLSFADAKGNPMEFPDTVDGIAEYVNLAVETAKETAKKEVETDFLGTLPQDVKDYYNHRLAGNDMDSFFENPLKDIHNVTLDKEDTDTAKRIVKMRLGMSGYDEVRIGKMIKSMEAADILYDTAVEDLSALQEHAKAEKEINDRKVRESAIRNEEKAAADLKAINDIIEKGKISNIEIPLQERKAFKEYITVVNPKTGMTQYQEDTENNFDVLMRDAYLTFKKGDLKNIVVREVGKAQVKTLRDRVNRTSDKTYNASNKGKTEFEISD